MMHDRRKGDRQQHESNRAHPRIRNLRLKNPDAQAHAQEEHQWKHPMPKHEVEVISEERADRSAEILNRRMRINRMARPIRRLKARDREQQKSPEAEADRAGNPSPE